MSVEAVDCGVHMAGQAAFGRKVSFTSGMLSLTLEDAPEGLLQALDGESRVQLTGIGRRASRNRLNALSESDDVEEKTPRNEGNDDANSLSAGGLAHHALILESIISTVHYCHIMYCLCRGYRVSLCCL